MTIDNRPTNCRFRLMDEGKTYPRSMCNACGKTIMSGLGKECTTLPAAPAPDDRPAARKNLIERLKGIQLLAFDVPGNLKMTEINATIQEAARELQQINAKLAIKGGDENYPTLWAYEQACKALEKHREKNDENLKRAIQLGRFIHARFYLEKSPDWTPLETVNGVLSQIDNMITHIENLENNSQGNWKPPAPDDRPEGLECLAFHRGKWVHVLWSKNHQAWSLGFAKPFITDQDRKFSPLPEKPKGAPGFFDYK